MYLQIAVRDADSLSTPPIDPLDPSNRFAVFADSISAALAGVIFTTVLRTHAPDTHHRHRRQPDTTRASIPTHA